MIKIEDLSFSYPKASRQNLDHLHAEFPEQTVNMIIGKNGSGKTTLFDLIANARQKYKVFLMRRRLSTSCRVCYFL